MLRSGKILIILILSLFAAYSSIPASDLPDLIDRVQIKELSNGLVVVYAQVAGSSGFRGICGYRFGSVDDPPARSGTAHLLEHLLFTLPLESGKREREVYAELRRQYGKGTADSQKRIKELEQELAGIETSQEKTGIFSDIHRTYKQAGGKDIWAVTTYDFTYYTATLSNEKIDLFCYLESERLKSPLESATAEDVYGEQRSLIAERKRAFEDNPVGALFEKRHSLAFLKNPYRNPVAGLAADIPSIGLKDVLDFKLRYYTPDNCVLVFVGNLQVDQLFNAIEKHFSDIPAGGTFPCSEIKDTPQLKELRTTMESIHDPRLSLSFHKPSYPHKDDVISIVVASLLTRGEDSRLYKDLVVEKKTAARVSAGSGPGERYDNLFTITVFPCGNQGHVELEGSIHAQLERLKIEEISGQELERAVDIYETEISEYVNSSANALGMTLLQNQLIRGDWSHFLKCIERCRRVSSEDINLFARKYFKKENMIVTVLKEPDQ